MAVVIIATTVAAFRNEDVRQVRRYRVWAVEGPPCRPVPARAALVRGKKRFNIGDITVARENGHLTCLEIKDNGGHGPGDITACHLLTPGALAVVTPSGAFGFDPGEGRSAAIFVGRSKVTCVAAVNAALFSASSERPYD